MEKMEREEKKLYSKMLKGKDSLLAKKNLGELKEKYGALKDKLKNSELVKARQYLPKLDSLNTALKFLNANGMGDKVKDALAKTELLKNKFQQAEEIKKFIKQRREQLKEKLENLDMVRQLRQINKQVYYYASQIKEYKEMLNDPTRIEKKALEILSKTRWFQEFFRKNSMLASLFRIDDPANPASMASIAGLQTQAQVQGLIQQRIRSVGPNGAQLFQQQIASAQGQLRSLQSRIISKGGSSSEDIMPEGFKPNAQKTKSFLQRLEYGTNLQSQKGNSYFPNSSDLAFSLGYKLNDKSEIGIGASYKLGLGRGWNNIRFTNEGIGLRSYVDWKIKGGLWISGGYEMNYRSSFGRIDALKDLNSWQQSGLLGLSKTVPIKSKFFKKTKVQALWDMLANKNKPRTQAVIFRVGYSFK